MSILAERPEAERGKLRLKRCLLPFACRSDAFYSFFSRFSGTRCNAAQLHVLLVVEQRYLSSPVRLLKSMRNAAEATDALLVTLVAKVLAPGQLNAATSLNLLSAALKLTQSRSCAKFPLLYRELRSRLMHIPISAVMGLSQQELQLLAHVLPHIYGLDVEQYFMVCTHRDVGKSDHDFPVALVSPWKRAALALTRHVPRLSVDVKELIADFLTDNMLYQFRMRSLNLKQEREKARLKHFAEIHRPLFPEYPRYSPRFSFHDRCCSPFFHPRYTCSPSPPSRIPLFASTADQCYYALTINPSRVRCVGLLALRVLFVDEERFMSNRIVRLMLKRLRLVNLDMASSDVVQEEEQSTQSVIVMSMMMSRTRRSAMMMIDDVRRALARVSA